VKACIDIGSNSIRLLIAKVFESHIEPVYKKLTTTRLGKGISEDGFLKEDSVISTINAIREYIEISKKYGCNEIIAFATSAVREAKNKEEFLRKVKKAIGLDVLVISGEDEARLSYKGARTGLGLRGKAAVIDIGGGSTEITYGEESPIESESFKMGAVRWTQRFLKSDPPQKEEIESLYEEEKEMLKDFALRFITFSRGEAKTVAVGGTATTACAIKLGLAVYDWKRVHGQIISKEELVRICEELLSLPLEDRRKIPGLMPERADIIITGLLILKNIMDILEINEIVVSESDLMEAILVDKFALM